MRYVLDTNLLCKEQSHPRVRNWIVQHQLQIAIASMTVAEIAQASKRCLADGGERNWKGFWPKCWKIIKCCPLTPRQLWPGDVMWWKPADLCPSATAS